MAKYYTPTIEELLTFIVNEKKCYLTRKAKGYGYYQFEFGELTLVENLHGFIENNDCDSEKGFSINPKLYYLKYLDKEDIKELGITINEWFISKGDIGGTYKITATGLEYNSIIYIHSKDFIRNGSGDYTISVMRFKIKNISELKIILEQRGILDAK